jgi:hypothetical protein
MRNPTDLLNRFVSGYIIDYGIITILSVFLIVSYTILMFLTKRIKK